MGDTEQYHSVDRSWDLPANTWVQIWDGYAGNSFKFWCYVPCVIECVTLMEKFPYAERSECVITNVTRTQEILLGDESMGRIVFKLKAPCDLHIQEVVRPEQVAVP